ncbi:gliding motility-associated C-terminal domain-containing protein [Adhaeribacter soli]|uniref:Gliding motility-associated C-terminal domain-containing protein n=1 Tax=Adhaeribacter soli TaxID=2607655 RepID=A0A5N1IPL9_9BACT|nr:gliding motility-associated C-terminal domain-containing protein [Adhaeribacter soli]KAA9325977.1 gliding motility-associated C-terminal domain-containing protein [Adhaeribacter soli]
MKRIFILIGLVSGLFFSGNDSQASHLVGGEFRIQAVGNFVYDIELRVYGDVLGLGPGNQDPTVDVATFSKQTNTLIETVTIPLETTEDVPYVNDRCQTGSIQTRILIYRIRRQLSPALYNNLQGYYMVWERCCRNLAVQNIIDPQGSGTVFYAEFPRVTAGGTSFVNSSPEFPPIPPEYLCAGQPYQVSMAAIDADGDSLVYELSEPLKGNSSAASPILTAHFPAPYSRVDWMPGFGLNAMIQGTPALRINSRTGLLSVTPATAGLFVFAFKCSEYRNGVKIGEVRRDVQVKINNCPTNDSPTVQVDLPDRTDVYKEGDTLMVTEATKFCYPVRFSDPDIGQQVTVRIEPVGNAEKPVVTPASGTVVQSGQVFNGTICWDPCRSANGSNVFKVNMIITDNACGSPASDTLQLTFKVVPKVNQKPTITVQNVPDQVSAGNTYRFTVTSTDAGNDNITVSIKGNGFDPASVGMQFGPLSGTGNLVSEFTWTPTCEILERNPLHELLFIVKDQNSCFAPQSDSLMVALPAAPVPRDTVFLAPNIFTPNGDGKNDFFTLPNLPQSSCANAFQEIKIYNRWGMEVFRSDDREFAWDAKNVSDGTYFYLIRYKQKKYKGYVDIVR